MSSQAIWEELLAGNARFAADAGGRARIAADRRQELVRGQAPRAAVLTCADSRVPPSHIFDAGLGDLFVVRNAGVAPDAGALASLEYSVAVLHTPLVVVMGHQSCGAVSAALKSAVETHCGRSSVAHPEVPHLNSFLQPLAEVALRALPSAPDGTVSCSAECATTGPAKQLIQHAVERSTLETRAQLTERSPAIREAVERGELLVVACVYMLDTGLLKVLNPEVKLELPTEVSAA